MGFKDDVEYDLFLSIISELRLIYDYNSEHFSLLEAQEMGRQND